MARSTPLAREEVIKMQRALLAEYKKPEFQKKLRAVLTETCSAEMKKETEFELRKLRENVGKKFGFEASPDGVEQSIKLFTPELRADPEIINICRQMEILLSPHLQSEVTMMQRGIIPKQRNRTQKLQELSMRQRAELAAKREAEETARKKALAEQRLQGEKVPMKEQVGRRWRVVGGKNTNGILARRGEDLHSNDLAARLATDAEVEELELIGERLHYRKISGEGPDFGWVSISVKGVMLLEPKEAGRDTQKRINLSGMDY
mmetsp:Transcript_61389/g.173138  ORF Transcript_61389/g.173138 Transcript_61389/m.173138 type:complete len:262 (-) Transcript_61389:74-859(-)